MNKDALLATVIGFTVGLLVTGIVLFGPGMTKNLKGFSFPKITLPDVSSLWKRPSPTPSPTVEKKVVAQDITIESPITESLEQTEKILISGSATPNATIILSSDVEDIVIKATEEGKYAGKITLAEGKNTVTATSITKEKQTTASVVLFYTPEDF